MIKTGEQIQDFKNTETGKFIPGIRYTHCMRGQEFSETNTYISPKGARQCRTCNKNRAAGLLPETREFCRNNHDLKIHTYYDGDWIRCRECDLMQSRKPESKSKRLKKEYQLDYNQYMEKLNNQNSQCAICIEDISNNPQLDHDHDTGLVREFLCRSCNTALGSFKDNPQIIQNAINYLRKHGK